LRSCPKTFGARKSWPRRGFTTANCLLGAALLANASAHAQEALRSYLDVDAAIGPQPGMSELLQAAQPDRSHLGPVDFLLGVYSGVNFDDNINLVETQPQADIIISAGMNVDLNWQATDTSALKFGTKIGYDKFVEHPEHDALELSPDSALSWDISFDDGGITLFDQFSYTRQVISEPAISGIGSIPRFSNTVGARGRWEPDKWSFELSLSREDNLSDASTFQYLDLTSENVLFRFSRRFAEQTRAGLEASVAVTDYKLSTQPDNNSYSIGPFVEWQVTQFLRADVRGGPTFYEFTSGSSAAGQDNLGSYYLNLDIGYQMTEHVRHQVSVARDVRLGINEGSKYIEQLTASYQVRWVMTDWCSPGFGVIYEKGSQPLSNFFFPVTEDFERVGLNPSISFQLTKKLLATVSYWHWDRTSNLPTRGYTENSAALSFNFTF
jgi:hypothetical protein